MAKVFNMTGGGAGGVRLMSISIVTPPNKTVYLSGESFDPAGMVVQAVYSNGAVLTATGYSVEPSGALADGTTAVTIRYTEGGVSVTAQQTITVKPRLTGISVTTPPSKTSYELNESFSTAGMVVTASYSDGSSKAVTGYTVTPSSFAALGTQNMTVSYTESGVTETATTAVTVERITISTVPSQSGSLTYNESAQSPTWSGYDTAKMTIGGTTSGTNAGTYAATFTPTASYRWADGTTTAKSVNWTIAKAAGSLNVSSTSVSLTASSQTATINVTRSGDGMVTATSSDTNVVVVGTNTNSRAGDPVISYGINFVITAVSSGTAKITVSVGEGTNHTAPASKTVQVTVQLVSSTLADNTPETIQQVAKSGQAPNYWSVGDKVGIAVNGTFGGLTYNSTVYAFILGFNHNSAVEGGNSIHFQFGKTSGGVDIAWVNSYGSTGTGFCMNTSNTNSGGWKSSYMRQTICPAFLSALPTAWQNVIAACTKYSDNTGGGSNTASYVTSTSDKIWLLAECEVFGSGYGYSGSGYANDAEKNYQKQYDYYANGNSKVKYQHSATTTACGWWLRSVSADVSSNVCRVSTGGGASNRGAYYSLGFAPGFKVA